MNDITKRFLLFLFGCIVIRVLFVIIAKYSDVKYLPYFSILSLLTALGFFIIYFKGLRKIGPETFGEKIWWNDLRPVHGMLYLIFSFMAFNKNKNSWIPLAIDVIIGFSSFIIHHNSIGSFKLLFK
jgi:hypothetical protein